jgi:hypothetical protein
MKQPQHLLNVGAPDPERKTSPIYDADMDEDLLDLELESGVCYFNDVRYRIGQWVRSGDEVLCCEKPGIWVRKSEVPT